MGWHDIQPMGVSYPEGGQPDSACMCKWHQSLYALQELRLGSYRAPPKPLACADSCGCSVFSRLLQLHAIVVTFHSYPPLIHFFSFAYPLAAGVLRCQTGFQLGCTRDPSLKAESDVNLHLHQNPPERKLEENMCSRSGPIIYKCFRPIWISKMRFHLLEWYADFIWSDLH